MARPGEPAGDDALAILDEALALWRGPALGEFADDPSPSPKPSAWRSCGWPPSSSGPNSCSGSAGRGTPSARWGPCWPSTRTGRAPGPRSWRPSTGRAATPTRSAAYQTWRRQLAEELGLEPSPALQRLERDILRHTVAGSQGTHTFLFTDIEASTRRWEEHTETMASDLARHDALLRQAIEGHGGRVFKHTGDGCAAVFPAASAALSAAVAGQLAVSAEQWGPGGPLRVRMALHTGPAESRDGDYFGPDPQPGRPAAGHRPRRPDRRLAGHRRAGPRRRSRPASACVDLGEHRLADLARPERIFQLSIPSLPADFPPLRSLERPRHNLPLPLTRFVGRERELERGGAACSARAGSSP